MFRFINGTIVLADGLLPDGELLTLDDRIQHVGPTNTRSPSGLTVIDLDGGYLLPGFVDLHVHGGGGADFMDGTAEAFRTVLASHARHGTASCTPTTTVARHEQHMLFLRLVGEFRDRQTGGAKVLGAHIYGPYFAPEARGCHPAATVRAPTPADYEPYLAFAADIRNATVAPELPGAEGFVAPAARVAFAVMPAIPMRHSNKLRLQSVGACGTSIICSARCPIARGCGKRKPTRCVAASWKPPFSSMN